MKVCIIFRPKSEYARQIEEFVHEFKIRTGKELEVLDIDSREGIAFASLYDVNQHPAIIATANDGQILKTWQGPVLPVMDDVAYYAQDQSS